MGIKYNQLTLNDRLTIEKMLNTKHFTYQQIADTVGCTRITIWRERKKGTITGIDTYYKEKTFYSGDTAHKITINNKKRQGAKLKIIKNKELINYIIKRITIDKYSPRAISQEIKKKKSVVLDYTSDNTIYRYIKRGLLSNIKMSDLPYEKTYHKKYLKIQKRASYGQSIEKRPAYINDRTEFGHWEMDSVEGAENSKKSLLVLSERKTRKELIFLNNNMTSEQVVEKINLLEKVLGNHFKSTFKTITMDNGTEFSRVEEMAKSIIHKNKKRTELYYCHPRTPTERGTNENINKMIRKYIPKGTDFDNKTYTDIFEIQEAINNYPRGIFNFDTSNDKFKKELQLLKIPKAKQSFFFSLTNQ